MPLEHAILAFLEQAPMSGYDLKKYFDQSIAHFWSASQSHIYKALDNLEKKGWLTCKLIPQEGKPNRKEYDITALGHAELRRWLTTPLPFEQVRVGWLIQIFFSQGSNNEEIAALLEAHIEEFRRRLAVYNTVAQAAIDENACRLGLERPRELWQITLDYGIAHYEHELAWHEQILARVRRLPPLE
jgi:PadR family transcriptional regulator, regulatory protein AphA